MTGFGPKDFGEREQLRSELGFRADERVVIATVGGSGVGLPLLERIIESFSLANRHVHHRLQRYRAGRHMDFADCELDALAAVIVEELRKPARFAPVETDGATRAAAMVAELL